jgi:hypothetical protein
MRSNRFGDPVVLQRAAERYTQTIFTKLSNPTFRQKD